MYKRKIVAAAIALLSFLGYHSTSSAHGATKVIAIVVGVGNHSGGAIFLGVPLTKVTIVGHPKDLGKVLGLNSYFKYASCNCILLPGPLGDCMVNEATKVSVPAPLLELREGQVVVLSRAAEFASVFNKVRSGRVGGGPPRPPIIVLPPIGSGGKPDAVLPNCEELAACEPAGKVEVSTTGETKFAVGCEDGVEIEFSTSGAVDLKLGPGPVKMVVPVKAASQ